MTTRRWLGTFLFAGILLAGGVVPAGAAPAAGTTTTSAALLGPNNRPCAGGYGNDVVGTVAIQAGSATSPVGTDDRALVVSAAAKVRARTTYQVVLAATVIEEMSGSYQVACKYWPAGTTVVAANGKLAFSGAVVVPRGIGAFQVFVGVAPGPADVGYTTTAIDVSGL